MNIDWFTFVAQVINFLILVALLRRLLYGPIVRTMQQREDEIARRLEEGNQRLQAAEDRVGEYEEKSRQLDEQREQLLNEARRDAHQIQQQLLKAAKEEVDRKQDRWHEAYQREQEAILFDLRRQAAEMGLQAARQTLAQLADADLERRMCDAFASRLERLNEEQREEITRHLGNGHAKVAVRSVFEVSQEQREHLRGVVHKVFKTNAEVLFTRSADLICGLELEVAGRRFSWNAGDYLHDLEQDFSARLQADQ